MAAAPITAPAPGRPGALRRGVNLTNWFRYPVSADPAALAAYLPDAAIARLRRAGFDFVRIAVQPEFLFADPARPRLLAGAAARLHRQAMATIIDPHPAAWEPERRPADAAALLRFWPRLAPTLRALDPALTVAEVLNEPVFPGDPAGWAALQREAVAAIRDALPGRRVLLTGHDWSSVAGLLALDPLPGPDLLYGFHFYDPSELTSLGAYRPGLDRAAMSRLPFPMNPATCAAALTTPDGATRALIAYACGLGWDTARIETRIGQAAAWGARHGAVVLLGEFGASNRLNAPARLAWIAAVRIACERRGIGWALWGYDDSMGFDIRPGGAGTLDDGVLRALGMG